MPITTKIDTQKQREFDAAYITVAEVRKVSNTAPSTVMIARKRGELPDAIAVNGGYVWHRAQLAPYLEAFVRNHTKPAPAATSWPLQNNQPDAS